MPPSTLTPPRCADVVRADEADDPVAEVGRALGGVEQADGVGIGADDEDRPADLPVPPHPDEDPPGDGPLDDHAAAARTTRTDSIQSRDSALNCRANGQRDHDADAQQRGVDDPAELLGRPLDGARLVQLVQRERDDPHRERDEGEHEVRPLDARARASERTIDCHDEGEHDAQRRRSTASARIEPLAERRGRDRARRSPPVPPTRRPMSAAARPPVMLPAAFNFRPSSKGG